MSTLYQYPYYQFLRKFLMTLIHNNCTDCLDIGLACNYWNLPTLSLFSSFLLVSSSDCTCTQTHLLFFLTAWLKTLPNPYMILLSRYWVFLIFLIISFISLLSSVFGGWENWFKEKEKLKFDALWCFGYQRVKTPNNLIGLCISVWWVMYVFFLVPLQNWDLCFTFELVNCDVVNKLSFLFRWIYTYYFYHGL